MAARTTRSKSGCQIQDLFAILGKPHVLDILHLLLQQRGTPRRFVDIQKTLHIAPKTLSARLKDLVRVGLITRTAYNEIPPRVDYATTPKAHKLLPAFRNLDTWATRHDLKPEIHT